MIQGALIFMCGVWTGVICGFFLAGAAMMSKRADEDTERQLNEMDADDLRITKIFQRNETTEI
jgi:hypothetical protein